MHRAKGYIIFKGSSSMSVVPTECLTVILRLPGSLRMRAILWFANFSNFPQRTLDHIHFKGRKSSFRLKRAK